MANLTFISWVPSHDGVVPSGTWAPYWREKMKTPFLTDRQIVAHDNNLLQPPPPLLTPSKPKGKEAESFIIIAYLVHNWAQRESQQLADFTEIRKAAGPNKRLWILHTC